MAVKKIYLIRHGQTEYNKMGVVQGSGIDAPLNSWGRKQAAAFYEQYRSFPFDKVYTSVLQRTHQSVEGFLKDGFPHESLSGLNEISWGEKEGRPFTPEENSYYLSVTDAWTRGEVDVAIKGGESPNQVMERQKKAFEHIMSFPEEKCILICMHGRAMRVLLAWLLNYELRHMDLFHHNNLGLYQLTFTGSFFTIDRYNDTRHLHVLEGGKYGIS